MNFYKKYRILRSSTVSCFKLFLDSNYIRRGLRPTSLPGPSLLPVLAQYIYIYILYDIIIIINIIIIITCDSMSIVCQQYVIVWYGLCENLPNTTGLFPTTVQVTPGNKHTVMMNDGMVGLYSIVFNNTITQYNSLDFPLFQTLYSLNFTHSRLQILDPGLQTPEALDSRTPPDSQCGKRLVYVTLLYYTILYYAMLYQTRLDQTKLYYLRRVFSVAVAPDCDARRDWMPTCSQSICFVVLLIAVCSMPTCLQCSQRFFFLDSK